MPASCFDFEKVAGRYDFCNRLFSVWLDRRWRKKAVRALNPLDGERVLDLCCGTGDGVFAFARYLSDVSIVGLDISRVMIEQAKKKQRRLERKQPDCPGMIEWRIGDAVDTGLPQESFDLVSCAFGLRNIPDRIAALREMRRLLRPGGRIGILEFSLPTNNLMRALYWIYLRYVMPAAGLFLFGSRRPLIYLAESIRTWNDAFDLPAACRESGLAYSAGQSLTWGIVTLHLLRRGNGTI